MTTQVRLSSADAVRLAQRFGRSTEEFEQIDGMTVRGAATRLGLSPENLTEALGQNAVRLPNKPSGAKKAASAVKKAVKKATAKKAAKKK